MLLVLRESNPLPLVADLPLNQHRDMYAVTTPCLLRPTCRPRMGLPAEYKHHSALRFNFRHVRNHCGEHSDSWLQHGIILEIIANRPRHPKLRMLLAGTAISVTGKSRISKALRKVSSATGFEGARVRGILASQT